MSNRKSTKRALLGSVMAMVLCLAMLVGATFAWFTDTASTGVNKIQAGNLDVALEMKDAAGQWVPAEGKTLDFVKAAAGEQVLWEPGCTYTLPELRVVNNGNLALKYMIKITGIKGDAKQHLAAGEGNAFTIKGHMKESAGNDYMNESIDGIAITVVATQDTVESDSFGKTYDKDAEYPITVTTGDELQSIVNNATAPVNIVLANSITTNNFVIPEDKDVTLDLNGRTVTNAESHTILNKGHLTLKDSSADKSGQIISLKGNTAALRNGDNAVCVVEGGTISRDGANGNTWHVVENFGKMTFNGGKVVLKNGNLLLPMAGIILIPVLLLRMQ